MQEDHHWILFFKPLQSTAERTRSSQGCCGAGGDLGGSLWAWRLGTEPEATPASLVRGVSPAWKTL